MSTNFEDLIMYDTRANQPAAGVPGRLYHVTDEGIIERDNGASWVFWGTAQALTNIVLKTLFDANTIIASDSDNTPTARTIAEAQIVGRQTGGSIGGIAQVSAGEKTVGTETALRGFSPDDVKDMVVTHSPIHDAADVTYAPLDINDWDYLADPGDTADGLDQLADRVKSLENAPSVTDAANLTYTPTVLADWNASADPGNTGPAVDQLAGRVKDLEGAGSLINDYICVIDQKAQNTAGGTFTTGAWQTRDLNTEQSDTGGHASVASNQITLATGTYIVKAVATAHAVNSHQARLQNITDATTILEGTSEIATTAASVTNKSIISGKFTLAAQKVLELQHRCGSTKTTNGYGVAANLTNEIYSIVELWKVA